MEQEINLETFDLITFDLDNTLAESKMPLDEEMAGLLGNLLAIKKVAVASGASLLQYKNQFLDHLKATPKQLANLFLLPTSGASMYEYDQVVSDWRQIYSNNLTTEEKNKILSAFESAFTEINLIKPEKIFGVLLEDRGTQITFSGLGSQAPLDLKKAWDPDRKKKTALANVLSRELPEFSVKVGGLSSVDVTKKGIDKAYGLTQLASHLNMDINRIIYVGDELSREGNDAPVLNLGIRCFPVPGGLKETKELVRVILSLK